MKMVNADDLKKEISKAPVWTALAVKEKIDEMTAELVRCKECRHWGVQLDGYCYRMIHSTNADDYCSYGERKESE